MFVLRVTPVLVAILAASPVLARPAADDDGSGAGAAMPKALSAESAGENSVPVRWYGAPALAIDGVNTAFFVTAAVADKGTIGPLMRVSLVASALTYVAGGAVVHGLNHQSTHAMHSVLLRVGGFVAGLLAAAPILASGSCAGAENVLNRPSGCSLGPVVLAAFPIAAMVIDDAYLARESLAGTPPPPPRAAVAPSLVVMPGLALFGLGGMF